MELLVSWSTPRWGAMNVEEFFEVLVLGRLCTAYEFALSGK